MGDDRGSLVAVEAQQDIPFELKRVYYIFGTKDGVERGFHAHKNLQKVVVRRSSTMRINTGGRISIHSAITATSDNLHAFKVEKRSQRCC